MDINYDFLYNFDKNNASTEQNNEFENWLNVIKDIKQDLSEENNQLLAQALGLSNKDCTAKIWEAMMQRAKLMEPPDVRQAEHDLFRQAIVDKAESFDGLIRSNGANGDRQGWRMLRDVYKVCPSISDVLEKQYEEYWNEVKSSDPYDPDPWHCNKINMHKWLYLKQLLSGDLNVRVGNRDMSRTSPQLHWCGIFAFYVLREVGRIRGNRWKNVQWINGGSPFIPDIDKLPVKSYTENQKPRLGDIVVITDSLMHHCIMIDKEVKADHTFNAMNGNSINQATRKSSQKLSLDQRLVTIKTVKKDGMIIEYKEQRGYVDYFYDVTAIL